MKNILFCLFLILSIQAFAQQGFNPYRSYSEPQIKRSPIRAVLNKFSLVVNTGYGYTFYKHSLPGISVLDYNGQPRLVHNYNISSDSITFEGTEHWVNAPTSVQGGVLNDSLAVMHYSDSVSTGFKGSGSNIPINLSLFFDIYRFRIGGGYMFEFHKVGTLKPLSEGASYSPDFGMATYQKYYGSIGAKVWDWYDWYYNIDIQVGKTKYGNKYSGVTNGLFFNVGVPIEYVFSEYFYAFVRPAFEYKSYSVVLGDGTSLKHNQPTVYVNLGVRIKYPEIPRCPMKSCETQLKHVHNGYEYRGQPFWKRQNPKIGENYRRLHWQKWRNKRKLNRGY